MDEKILENEEIIESMDTEGIEPEVESIDAETYEESEGSGIGTKVLKGVGIGVVVGAAGYAVKRFVYPKVKGAIDKVKAKRAARKEYAVMEETKDGVKVMSLKEIRDKEVSDEEPEKEE